MNPRRDENVLLVVLLILALVGVLRQKETSLLFTTAPTAELRLKQLLVYLELLLVGFHRDRLFFLLFFDRAT